MSSTSRPQSSADPGAPALEAVVITSSSPPEGYESETLSEVPTPFGVAVVRVRRHTEFFHVGGVGPVRTPVYSVAVRTPRSVRERQAPSDGGFVTTHPHFLFTGPDRLGYTPGNAAEVHVAVGREIERAVDRKLVEAARRAAEADRPPRRARRVPRPQLPSAPGMEEPAGDGPALRPVPPAEGAARPFRIVRPNRAA